MKPMRIATLLALVLALTACGGQSKQEKATSQVCDARSSIAKQVDSLKNLTVSTATVSQIKTSLTAIKDDLGKIKDAQGDLSDQRKSQVQQANDAFTKQVESIGSSLLSTLSLGQAKDQLQASLQQLADSYRQTFAKIDCSGA
jgi:chromosome segregation ATPase